VRMCSNKKYAVNEFRKRQRDETEREYVKKLVSEFCISSSLDNPNVVKTVDLIQGAVSNSYSLDEKHHWCVVMEFCSGGDLYHRIHDSNGLHDTNEKLLLSTIGYGSRVRSFRHE
jgi:serine/threonine protein kinase